MFHGTIWGNIYTCPFTHLTTIGQDTRRQLFADYLESGKDVKQVQARFEDRMIQAQRTTLRYGFRNETWLIKHHGERRARKIQERKKQLGLNLGLKLNLIHVPPLRHLSTCHLSQASSNEHGALPA